MAKKLAQVGFRVDYETKAKIAERAEAEGLSITEYLLRCEQSATGSASAQNKEPETKGGNADSIAPPVAEVFTTDDLGPDSLADGIKTGNQLKR